MRYYFSILIVSFLATSLNLVKVFAQCPTVIFNVPDTVCINQNLLLENNSTGGLNYSWKFCSGAINTIPIVRGVVTADLANVPTGMTQVYDGVNFYGFFVGLGNNTLYRLDYGNALSNTPSINTLGNPQGALSNPIGVKIIAEGSNWIGLVSNGGNSTLIRLNFGNTLQNTPVASNVAVPVAFEKCGLLDIVKDGNDIFVLIANEISNNLSILNFASSLTNNPTGFNINITGASRLMNVSAIKDCNHWYALAVGFSNSKVYKLNFGTSLLNIPSIIDITSFLPSVSNPIPVSLLKDQGKYYGLIGDSNGKLYKLNFANALSNNSPSVTTLLSNATFATQYGFHFLPINNSEIIGSGISYDNNAIIQIKFSANCSANTATSDEVVPVGVFYSKPGKYSIDLTGTNTNGNSSTQTKEVVAVPLPSVDFKVTKQCIGSSTHFEGSSDYKVTKWFWDFGDGSTANAANVDHIYSLSGTYEVKLTIQNKYECTNTITKSIVISNNKPTPDFSFPDKACSNDLIQFNDLSTPFTGDVIESWLWTFGDPDSQENTSTLQNPKHRFNNADDYQVSLTVSGANGCEVTTKKTISVKTGAKVGFSFIDNICEGDPVLFTNQTTPDASWQWNFGDVGSSSNTSNEKSPSHIFSIGGIYTVSLQVTTSNGCIVTQNRNIHVRKQPNFKISFQQNADAYEIEFAIKDLLVDTTVVLYNWNFGDTNSMFNTSTLASPHHLYPSPGNYTVSLEVLSAAGCQRTISQKIIVNPPLVSFSLPNEVCLNENLSINNNSFGGTAYAWDFCMGDLEVTPNGQNLGKIVGSSLPLHFATVFDGVNYFLFVTSRGTNELFRVDFGTKLTNNPVITKLVIPNNNLDAPEGIVFYKEDNNWYAVVANTGNSSLTRIGFGMQLTNIPTASNVIQLSIQVGLLSFPRGMDIVQSEGNIILAVANANSNQISLINFGSTITNDSPSGSNFSIPGSSSLFSIKLVASSGKWYGLCSAALSNSIHKISFGISLSVNPLAVTNILTVAIPFAIEVQFDNNEYYAFISSGSGNLTKINFGTDLSNVSPIAINIGNPVGWENITGLSLNKQFNTEWIGIGINYDLQTIYRLSFPNNEKCVPSIFTSSEVEPIGVAYSKPGKYYIELRGINTNGKVSMLTDSILVKSTIAPTTHFTINAQCIQQATKFFGPSHDVTSWQWDFGDTNLPTNSPDNTSSEQNPTHQYTKAGNYLVSLLVQSGNNCRNHITQSVTIYDNPKPFPAFSFPNGLCSFAEVAFTDQSVPAPGDDVRNWRWDFGDGKTSTAQNPIHAFTQGGDYQVTLSVSGISGCDTTISQKIAVLPGANVNFDYAKVCIGDTMTFTNLTAPEGNWLWNFGDPASASNTSTEKSPRHFFSSVGNYTVKLSVTTANGCVVSHQKVIKVRTLPTVDFIYSKVCANSPISFTISAVQSDTTIVGIAWDFGDTSSNDNISSEESPIHTFAKAGIYTVRLTIVTISGCQGFITHQVEVTAPSIPDFNSSAACANRPVAFSDVSLSAPGDAINSWSWNFGDSSPLVSVKSPVHTYANPGVYTVRLTVTGKVSSCKNTVSKQVRVYAQPQVNFTATPSCIDYSVHFTDNSSITNGQIQSREWSFGGEGTSTEQNPVFNFNRTGTFVVTLKVSSGNGCSAVLSRSVIVDVLPEADFSFSPDFQAPPIEVKFKNSSIRATNYQWDFGDGSSVSTEVNPRHIYQAIGTYSVKLLAFRNSECADTLIKPVNVAIVVLNAQVSNVAANTLNGLYVVVAEVANKGTVPITSLDLILKAGSTFSIQEKWTGVLNPEQSFIYPFKAQVVKNSFQELPYFCVASENPNGQTDNIPADNRFCRALLNEFTVLPVYPNPGSTQTILTCILPQEAPVEAYLFDIQGKRIASFLFENTKAGFNEFSLDISSATQGLYMLQTIYQGQIQGQRLMKKN